MLTLKSQRLFAFVYRLYCSKAISGWLDGWKSPGDPILRARAPAVQCTCSANRCVNNHCNWKRKYTLRKQEDKLNKGR